MSLDQGLITAQSWGSLQPCQAGVSISICFTFLRCTALVMPFYFLIPCLAFLNKQPTNPFTLDTPSHPLSSGHRTGQDIDLFSVRTGKKLRSMLHSSTFNSDPGTCLKFSRIRSTFPSRSDLRKIDNEPLSLLASSWTKITEWSCHGDGSNDDGEQL
jgi:hypothetical protein